MISSDERRSATPDHLGHPLYPSRSRAGWIVLILSSLAIAFATLLPGRGFSRPLPTICVFCGDYGGIDFTLNIILFIPYGIGLYLLLRRPWRAVGIAMATTLAIEILQLQIISGRDTSLGDLVANTLGAAIGVYLTRHWRGWILPPSRRAGVFAGIALTVWAGLLILSAWALQPSPTKLKWFSQATPDLLQFGRFRGTFLGATIDGEPLIPSELPLESPTYAAFEEGHTTIQATVIPGWRLYPGTLAPIVSIFDRQEREIFVFGQKGLSLVFRSRTNTSTLWLREPTVSLSNVFPNSYPRRVQGRPTDGSRIGDTVSLSAIRTPSGVELRAVSPVGTRERRYAFHIFMLWNALLPFDLAFGVGIDVLSALWAFGLIFLPAYWFFLRNGQNSFAVKVLFFGIPATVLHLIPLMFGLQSSPWWAWVASALGVLLGWRLARFARSRSMSESHIVSHALGNPQPAGLY